MHDDEKCYFYFTDITVIIHRQVWTFIADTTIALNRHGREASLPRAVMHTIVVAESVPIQVSKEAVPLTNPIPMHLFFMENRKDLFLEM